MTRSAVIYGPNDEYRPELRRVWDISRPLLVTGMLNPSDADAERDDPTILTLCHFGKLWRYGGLLIVNEYDFRSPSPMVMRAAPVPCGPLNDEHIANAMIYANNTTGHVLAAWGNGCNGERIRRHATAHGVRLMCLGTTLSGAPKHPLARGAHRVPRDTMPVDWP